jgi:hypothetical protein
VTPRSLLKLGGWCLALAVVALAAYTVREEWTRVGPLVAGLSPSWGLIGASALTMLAAYGVLVLTWRRQLAEVGAKVSLSVTARLWFVSSLARYIPGALWQLGALGAMAARRGIPVTATLSSAVLMTVMNVATGLVLVAALGFDAARLGATGWTALVVGIAGLVSLRWLTPLASRLLANFRRADSPVLQTVSAKGLALGIAGNVIAWLGYGLGFYLLARATFPGASLSLLSATAVYLASYLAGLLAFAPPAGVGVADGALVALLTTSGLMPAGEALVLAGIARVWRTAVEVAPGVLMLLITGPEAGGSRTGQGSPPVPR